MNDVKDDIKQEITNMKETMKVGFNKLHDDIRFHYIDTGKKESVVNDNIEWEKEYE